MTQRIAVLLDEATADLVPRSTDPVAEVIGRGRAARRRSVLAGALAMVAVLGGGAAIGGRLVGGDDDPSVPAATAGPPPTPRQVGDAIVAGGLILPVPAGWRVVPADSTLPCGMLTRTIVLNAPDGGGCRLGSIEVTGVRDTNAPGWLAGGDVARDPIIAAPVPITLHGGEPAWLTTPTDDEINRPRPGFDFWNTLLLPWSRVSVTLRVDGPEQQKIIDSIRSAPSHATRLVLPATAAKADLTIPDPSGDYRPTGHGTTTDRATIAAVLRLLRGQKTVVDGGHACANPGQQTARLTLRGSGDKPPTTTVVITLADNCREAVSSDGGRVRLSAETVRALKNLFGITQ